MRLLEKLERQATEDLFDYSIVVVDNDRFQSAKQTAESYARQSKIPFSFYTESEQNIALARNKAIENSKGDLIALIDDDEFPIEGWLLNLYKALNRYNSDGVLGPVLPHFDENPPKWIMKGRLFERPTHSTGQVLDWRNTRTGNVLLKKENFGKEKYYFDPAFGSGGEDRDFFKRKIGEGRFFVWCNEAPVFETVPPERWKRRILMKRAFLRGKMSLNNTGSKSVSVFKSLVAIFIYTGSLPVFFFLSHHVFMKFLIKDCDHLGKILAVCGVNLIKEKYVRG